MSCDELLDYLKSQGCTATTHSSMHYWVINPKPNPGGKTIVTKGNNISPDLIKLICKNLHVPAPKP